MMNEHVSFNGRRAVGLGEVGAVIAPAAVAASPWSTVLATSVVSAVTGLVVEEIVKSVRKKRKRR